MGRNSDRTLSMRPLSSLALPGVRLRERRNSNKIKGRGGVREEQRPRSTQEISKNLQDNNGHTEGAKSPQQTIKSKPVRGPQLKGQKGIQLFMASSVCKGWATGRTYWSRKRAIITVLFCSEPFQTTHFCQVVALTGYNADFKDSGFPSSPAFSLSQYLYIRRLPSSPPQNCLSRLISQILRF
jgi:hypothetical protein